MADNSFKYINFVTPAYFPAGELRIDDEVTVIFYLISYTMKLEISQIR